MEGGDMQVVVSAVQPAASGLRVIGSGEKPAQLASQTAPVGVILPPPDIRSIVDKTAQFVARNGPEFEKRILANEKGNVKFNFLVPGDPYSAYYQQKVAAFRAEEAGVKLPAEPAAAAPKTQVAEAPAKVAVQLPTHFKPVVLEEPEKEQYTLVLPDGITALDLDVIKLTAQFVARNGKSFLTGLTSREHTNPQFNFLKPTHSMFPFFTSLADMYSKVLMPPKALIERLRRDADDKPGVLDRCLKRLEWERSQARARKEAEDKEEAEREAMAMIDWHDFVVVETIDFYNDEDEGLPPPLSLREVIAQLRSTSVEAPPVQADDGAMDVEMDEEERAIVAEGAPPPAPLPPAPEPQMKIVRNYKPPGARGPGPNAGHTVVSPITGELVPIDQIAEHMRISLIDPKWRKEREAMLGKLRGSTAASDEEIARNVVSLARTRPDIFGNTDEEVSLALSAEMEGQRRQAAHAATVAGPSAAPPSLPPAPAMQPLPARPPMPLMPSPWGLPGMPPPMPGYMPPMPGYGYMPGFPPPLGQPYPGMMPPGMAPPPMPMGMPMGMPPGMAPPPGPPPAPSGDEQEAKRQRVEEAPLVAEEDFAEANQGPVVVRVTLPEVDGDAQLRGQTIELELASVMETIGDVKARLASVVGVASSKQKMSTQRLGFLKDTSTLAVYNFGAGTEFVMGLKERGGRTKK